MGRVHGRRQPLHAVDRERREAGNAGTGVAVGRRVRSRSTAMRGKIFTVDEANRMLPLVERIAEDIVATYGDVNVALQAYEATKAEADGNANAEPELRKRDQEVGEV